MTLPDEWKSDLAEIAAKSPSPIVRRFPPRLVFAKKPLGGYTGFFTITISNDLVNCSPSIRRYLLAHELGHFGWGHPYLTTFGGLCCVAPLLSMHPNGPPFNAISLGFGIFGFVIILLFSKSLIFEKVADRAGARMIGVDAMQAGIADIKALRKSKNIDVDEDSYARKVAWLDGKKASIWR